MSMLPTLQPMLDRLGLNDEQPPDREAWGHLLEQLRAAWADASATVARASNAREEFLAIVGHELRTPLNGILGMADLLADTALGEEQAAQLGVIRRSATTLLGQVCQVLDYADLRAPAPPVPYDLRGTLQGLAAAVAGRAAEARLAFAALIHEDVPARALGSPVRLRRAVLELLSNALKFTERGEVLLRARLETDATGAGWVRIEVVDTGIGVSADKLERIFEPLTLADPSPSRAYGGIGLGLATCRRLAALMGGRVGAQSVPGRGSTFWLAVPVLPSEAGSPAPACGPDQHEPSASGAGTLLVVEDNPINQQVALGALRKLGYRADLVPDGSAALRAVAVQAYDAVLMDCQMPVMDGFEATREIRRLEGGGSHVPIIALTANAAAGGKEQCLAAGMDDFLSKPVNLGELQATLQRWVPASGSPPAPAAPVATEPDEIVLDEAVLEGLRSLQEPGEPDILAELVGLFLADAPRSVETIREAVRAQDGPALHGAAHALKGCAATIGARNLAARCQALERKGATGELAGAGELAEGIAEALSRVEAALVPYVAAPARKDR